MEDIGDYLFYIIAAVIGLATTFGKKKRQAARKNLPPKPEVFDYQETDLVIEEEVLAVGNPIEREDFWDHDPIKESFIFDPELEGKYIEPMAEEFRSEGKAQLVKKGKVEVEEKLEEVKVKIEKEDEEIAANFDLREAVIFSEILNRKDY